jgi:hypothetical protein
MSDVIDPMEEARRRIAAEAEQRTGSLDLSRLDLTSLPAEIAGLSEIPCMAGRLNDTVMPWPV